MISDLGKNIRNIRTEKKMSIVKLAEIAGIGNSTISQIESGRRQTLQGATIEKIANALEVSTSDLLGDETQSRFETNDALDILNIMMYADFVTFDGVPFSDEERILLETNIRMSLDAIRYDRLKKKFGTK